MSRTPRPKPRRSNPPPTQTSDGTHTQKPYEFIPFPNDAPQLQRPAGHHKYHPDRLHGTLSLKLCVETALHVSTGVVALGSDVGSRVPLIKTMVQGTDQALCIQGSSLKGCIRTVYEAITNSTLAVVSSKYRRQVPEVRLPCKNKEQLCPASQVFGALDWQGLIEFSDAKATSTGYATGFMPSLHRPRPDQRQAYFSGKWVVGRKFYYHTVRAIDQEQNAGISVQQAAKSYTFSTQLHFINLQAAELGTLLVILGQDPNYPIALKLGGGKPIGMGTMTVQIDQATIIRNQKEFCDRYTSYIPKTDQILTGEPLKTFIEQQINIAHSRLIEKPQLDTLLEILRYPTDREPPEGIY